jgi:hypothetical protein
VNVLSSEQFAAAARTVIAASDGIAEELQPALRWLCDSGRAFNITGAVDALSRQLAGRQYSAHCAHGGVYLVLSPSRKSCYLLFLTMHLSAPLLANGDFAWEGLPAAVQFARAQGPLWVAVCLSRVLQGLPPLVFEETACATPSLHDKGLAQCYRGMVCYGGELGASPSASGWSNYLQFTPCWTHPVVLLVTVAVVCAMVLCTTI